MRAAGSHRYGGPDELLVLERRGAGTVVALGGGVRAPAVGDAVIAMASPRQCGRCAEFAVLPADRCALAAARRVTGALTGPQAGSA
ncbi:alcohol dehydrogenase catalytic domain-containing protein [Arthrobacter sp. TMS1-12-1]